MIYPRILFISPVGLNSVNGGGIMFRNLFSAWPNDSLAIIHHDPYWNDINSPIRSFRLSDKEISYMWPFSIILKRTSPFLPVDSTLRFSKTSKFHCIRKFCRLFLQNFLLKSLPEISALTPELFSFIENYKPDIIYTILGSNGLMELILSISCSQDKPLCIHIMDDWITSSHQVGLFSYYNRNRMASLFRSLLNKTSSLLTISQSMSDEYSMRYAIASKPIMNAINPPLNLRSMSLSSSTFNVVYIGSVLANAQLDSILDVASAINNLSRKGFPFKLTVFCNIYQQKSFQPYSNLDITLLDLPTTDDDFFRTIHNASCLLLPSNFDKNSYEHIRFSLPAKIPAYLSSNTPILLYGPANTAQSNYALNDGWALVLNTRSLGQLEESLLELYLNPSIGVKYSENAFQCFINHHQLSTVQHELYQTFANLDLGPS